MKQQDSHRSDQQLLLDVDGELSAHDSKALRAHLASCWKCRARRQELENAITGFARVYHRAFDQQLPPGAGPRALLKARMQRISEETERRRGWFPVSRSALVAAGICSTLAVVLLLIALHVRDLNSSRTRDTVITIPDRRLTPGAILRVSQPMVCTQPAVNNKKVPATLREQVFDEYGIRGADPRAYEVDYLITPALGGADDIHNLWPHSYSAGVWNASVKDALEDRLREMVCDGSLDLSVAQQEIATNWIAAYKKYFHTDRPLAAAWK